MGKAIAIPADSKMARNSRITIFTKPERPMAHAQHEEFSRSFRSQALCIEGPFADVRGAVADLAGYVRQLMRRSGERAVSVTRATLAPMNMPGQPPSLLTIPFIDKMLAAAPYAPKDCAGAVALAEPGEFRDRKVRVADMQELAMLAVAILRRLGVESFFGVFHYEDGGKNGRTPCIVLPQPGHAVAAEFILPPSAVGVISGKAIALEILDADALLSITRMKQALTYARGLMAGSGDCNREKNELRAMQIAHLAGAGTALWAVNEWALENRRAAGISGFVSIRETVQQECIHPLMCAPCHENMAIAEILGESAPEALLRARAAMPHGRVLKLADFIETPSRLRNALERVGEYMRLAAIMSLHFHSEGECGEMEYTGSVARG